LILKSAAAWLVRQSECLLRFGLLTDMYVCMYVCMYVRMLTRSRRALQPGQRVQHPTHPQLSWKFIWQRAKTVSAAWHPSWSYYARCL